MPELSKIEKEEIRLDFFRKYKSQKNFSSVALKKLPTGEVIISVGITGPVELPDSYGQLRIVKTKTDPAFNLL